VQFQLYTVEATRGAEVRVHRNGQAYYIALEHTEGTIWKPLGDEVGPYGSPEEAEIAAVNSEWFMGGE
jgi:hypothetical protein